MNKMELMSVFTDSELGTIEFRANREIARLEREIEENPLCAWLKKSTLKKWKSIREKVRKQ